MSRFHQASSHDADSSPDADRHVRVAAPAHHRAEPAHRRGGSDDDFGAGDLVGFVAAEEARAITAPIPIIDGSRPANVFERLRAFTGQMIRFAIVGGLGFIVESVVFNALYLTVWSPEHMAHGMMWSKIAATLVAIVTNWVGNRLWTFRNDRRHDRGREGLEFFLVSLVGLVVGLIPIWVASNVMGLHDLVSANLANVCGLVLGSVFRFACYRYWVYSPKRPRVAHAQAARAAAEAEDAA